MGRATRIERREIEVIENGSGIAHEGAELDQRARTCAQGSNACATPAVRRAMKSSPRISSFCKILR